MRNFSLTLTPKLLGVRAIIAVVMFFSAYSSSPAQTLTKEQYYDKTLAMLIGSCGGVVTGYEYLKVYNTPNGFYQPGATLKQPVEFLLGLPDDWFILLNGTLGGTTRDEYNYFSNYEPGIIYSDDDQHVEVLNQHILEKFGPAVAYQDIKQEWVNHELMDFGGTADAIGLINSKNLIAPLMGQREHGNYGHWLPECYIEHEMMGANFPGMPNKAAEYVAKFASMSGEGENLLWGQYWAAAHAIAYFETDARVVIEKALGVLPQNCFAREMYQVAVDLHKKYPNDWRAAVRELWNDHRRGVYAVGSDKIHLQPEVNHGIGLLSVLYGANNYMETLKICSLAGGDGDCTAANICGMMGIIKGMAGTPAAFVDKIYANGEGKWINDMNHALHMNKDFPVEHKFTDLTLQFQRNMERMIRAYGGKIVDNAYQIQPQSASLPSVYAANWDFEHGDFNGWQVWNSPGSNNSVFVERQCNDVTRACLAATGEYKATLITGNNNDEAKVFKIIGGLQPGATYKIEGRLNATAGREARLYADNYGGSYIYTSIYQHLSDFPYRHLYVTLGPTNTSMEVGVHAPPSSNPSKWINFDDLVITKVSTVPFATYEAENGVVTSAVVHNSGTASGGRYVGGLDTNNSSVQFNNIQASYSGEHIVRIYYANATASMALHQLSVNGKILGNVEYPDSGPWGQFSQNFIEASVRLNKGGDNVIKLSRVSSFAEIDRIEVEAAFGGQKPSDDAGIVTGGIYKIINKNSQKSLDVGSASQENGKEVVQWDYFGSDNQKFRLEEINSGVYAFYAVHSNKVLDDLEWSLNDGAQVVQWQYAGTPNQQWSLQSTGGGFFKIINNHSGKAMVVAESATNNGAPIVQSEYTGDNGQQWMLEKIADPSPNEVVSGGVYSLINKFSGKALDVDDMSQGNLAQLIQWEYFGNLNQKYRVELVEGGFYKLIAMHSGKAVEVEGFGLENGHLIKQYDYWGGINQHWQIIPAGDGYYKIINRNSGKALDVLGVNPNNGAQVGQWDDVGGNTQLWKFDRDFNNISGYAKVAAGPLSVEKNEVTLYPNPAKTIININLPNAVEKATVIIMDTNGKVHYENDAFSGQTLELNTSHLKKGIYYVKTQFLDKNVYNKIIVE